MNEHQKREYELSKYIVKQWESEFKSRKKMIPTRADITRAPIRIKEAYKAYWKLKTLQLESTLADVLNDNASDGFNTSLDQSIKCNDSIDSLNNSKDDVKKLETKSVSFQYAEKLFKGSKFNKRNPRKPFKRSKTVGEIPECSKSLVSEISTDTSDSTMSFSEPLLSVKDEERLVQSFSQVVAENNKKSSFSQILTDEDDACFNLINETTKIVKTSNNFSSSAHAVSLLQKKFDEGSTKRTSFSGIDQGWLDRVSQSNQIKEFKKIENVSQDSGIDTSSHSQTQPLPDAQNETTFDSKDSIYETDTETQNSNSRFTTLKTFDKPENKRQLENPEESVSKRQKVDFKISTTKPEILPAIKNISKQKEVPIDPEIEKKLKLLERSLASGKANENFLKINIQKKVYVRGRKNMTFSTYKKNKWKQLKKDNDINSGPRGVLKCFRCGDVGHFSKGCPNPTRGLIPLEDVEVEDDSPFPTLSEAAEQAEEASEKAHNGHRRFTVVNKKCNKAPETALNQKDQEQEAEKNKDENNTKSVDKVFETYDFPDELLNEEFDKGDIKPIYVLNEDGSTIDTTKEVKKALKDFGHTTFLPGQEKAIMRILSGQSTLVTLSTGSGKSLCYQLPAYIYSKYYPKSIVLVVSPLISLMIDQVQGVSKCLKVATLHSNMTEKKREAVLEQMKSGDLSVLLVSPETLVSLDSGYGKLLMANLPPIAFACVDEAHCLYQWCHNFRPSYMTVTQVLKEKLGVKTLLGLTATASNATIECILSHIGLDPYDKSGVITDTPLPPNLILSASITYSDEQKLRALMELLKGEQFGKSQSIIVYCTRREQCDNIASHLRASLQKEDGKNNIGRLSIHAEPYHAGLKPGRRNLVQSKFMSGALRIVVATMAFGMGIDKNDIRGIIHFNMPSTFENYVQEVGRAGRDRKPAYCHLFLDEKKNDLGELRKHIYSNTIDRHTIRKLLQMVFVQCTCKDECPKHEIAFSIENTVTMLDVPQENISTLLAYLELDKKKWIKTLPLAYTKCKVTSYKGSVHLKNVAKSCPPLTLAMAREVKDGSAAPDSLEFDVVSLAKDINWDSGVVKKTLKNLEWTKINDKPKKTGIAVQLSNLGFHILAPGNLGETELDEALDILCSTVTDQEKNSLCSLQVFYNSLRKVAFKTVKEYCTEADLTVKSESLKEEIRGYFINPNLVRNVQLDEVQLENELSITSDIRRLISQHRDEHNLTGRSIARILHGIGSPNFPPIVWGRTKFWRLYLDQDFNLLCKLATKQLILMR